MHPIIEKIKQECWDGEDRMPTGKMYNIYHDNPLASAEEVQKQIDNTPYDTFMVYVLDKECKVRRYPVEKKSEI